MPCLKKHPKSPYWSAWFTDENAQRTSRSTKQRKKSEALKVALQWEDSVKASREGNLSATQVLKVHNQMLSKSGQKVTTEPVEAFAKRWVQGKQGTRAERTAGTYGPIVDAFLKTLGNRVKVPMTAIGPREIESFRDTLAEGGRKASTIRQALKVIGAMFNAAKRQGLVETNPVPAVEVNDSPQQHREPFTPDEIGSLIAHANDEWKTAILLGGHAGMRLGDAVRLRWENVDLISRLITFTPEKTQRKGRELTVPMTQDLYDHLMAVAGDTGGFVCPTLAKVGSGGRAGLSLQFKALMAKAGIENRILAEGKGKGRTQSAKSFHSLRHSFNSALLNAGVDEKIRMDLSGHTTTNVNRMYSHSKMEVLREAMAKIKRQTS